MSYRKLKADYLFTGHSLAGTDEVLIIKADGEVGDIINEKDAGDNIEIFSGILTPGFINAHCHLELSHMKGLIAEKKGLIDFVYRVVNERHFAEDEILTAIENAREQMINTGIVAVGDICNNALTLSQKKKGGLRFYNFIEAAGWAPSVAELRWQASKALYEIFKAQYLTASIVPHAPYSVSDALWQKLIPFFEGKTVTMHNQETVYENELFETGKGNFLKMFEKMKISNPSFLPGKTTSLQTCFTKFSGAASVILVHNTFTSQQDINYIKEKTPADQLVSFCLCPNANLYIEDTLPPVDMLVKNDCSIVLGTDSLSSNRSLNILDEIKTIQSHFPLMPLEKILQWATLNGAKALQMDGLIGSFERGKKPGVVLIENTDGLRLKKGSAAKKMI